MAALDFPASPSVGQLYPNPAVAGVPQYRWDGSAWSTVAPGPSIVIAPPTITKLLSGSGTYNTPANCIFLRVRMGGGGAGGGGSAATPTSGTNGGNSTFGLHTAAGGNASSVSAGGLGGSGTIGAGANGSIFQGGGGQGGNAQVTTNDVRSGGMGGNGMFGGAAFGNVYSGVGAPAPANSGGGGGGGGSNNTAISSAPGGGGGGGLDIIIPNPASSYAYSVGVGGNAGAAGSGGIAGGAGGSGAIYVEEYYGSATAIVPDGVVRYDQAQTLTAPQQAQAVSNIGVTAVGTSAVGQIQATNTATVPAAGKVGERVISNLVGSFSGSGVVQPLGSVTLSAGVWDLEMIFVTSGGGATSTSDISVGICPTNGTSPVTGAIANSVNMHYRLPAALDVSMVFTHPRVRVSSASAMQYFANMVWTGSGGSYGGSGLLIATRV